MGFSIRNLTPKDIDRAVEIIEETNPEPSLTGLGEVFRKSIDLSFRPELYNMAPCFVGAEIDGVIQSVAGYAWSNFSGEVWELCWGSVAKAHQSKGIGDAMIKFRFQEILKRAPTEQVYVVVHSHATKLYLSNGFEKTKAIGIAGKYLLTKKLK